MRHRPHPQVRSNRSLFVIAVAFWLVLAGAAVEATAQPSIVENGIVNAASFMPPSLPGGSIAQGSIFSIFGQNLGPDALETPPGFPVEPLETSLAGVTVTVSGGGTSVNAFPVAVVSTQINAIMPSNAPLGDVEVTVTFNGQSSAPAPVTVVNSSVGIFTATGTGSGPASIINFNSETDQPLNTPRDAARPGQFVTMWATGLGPIDAPDNQRPIDVGAVMDLTNSSAALTESGGPGPAVAVDLVIFVGGAAVTDIFYAGRSAEFAGADQIIFEVPAGAPPGCFVPVQLTTDGVPSNGVTMAIEPEGQPCSDENPLSQTVISGGRLGSVALLRIGAEIEIGPPIPALDVMLDSANASFAEQPGGETPFNPLFSLPPPGSCSSITTTDLDVLSTLGGDLPDLQVGRLLDAGPALTIARAGGETKSIPQMEGSYSATLGGGLPLGGPVEPLFLEPGMFTITGPGGADVGPFSVDVLVPITAMWTNRDALATVNRAQGVTFQWSGGDPGQIILLAGANLNTVTEATGIFVCLAEQSAGTFTVPPANLAGLPPSVSGPNGELITVGFLIFGSIPTAELATIEASGLDGGFVLYLGLEARTTTFQ